MRVGLIICMALFCLTGCHKAWTPPPPLSEAEIPSDFQKTFAKASPEVKDVIGQAVAAIQSKDYPAAYTILQGVYHMPGVTQEERELASQTLLTLNGLMQTAESQGDQRAADFLRLQRATK